MNKFGNCCYCPRKCGVNRTNGGQGYCRTGSGFHIGSICVHTGEEPVISGPNGICNIFFSHCNLQCIFCQNHQISTLADDATSTEFTLDQVIEKIEFLLDQGCTHVGFVSPSHVIPQVIAIIKALCGKGRKPVFVYNSNGYDRVESLQLLEGLIDVYLPDLKYMDAALAAAYSGAVDYPQVAAAALKEMFRQKGSTLIRDEHNCAESGLIIRHLVLPGHTDNSKAVLQFIAEELSPLVHVSLMSQYYPTARVINHPILGRQITAEEYNEVTAAMESFGIFRGWVQDIESHQNYRPDFNLTHPFDEQQDNK